MQESIEIFFAFWQLWNFGLFAERMPWKFLEMADATDAETIELLETMTIYFKSLQSRE